MRQKHLTKRDKQKHCESQRKHVQCSGNQNNKRESATVDSNVLGEAKKCLLGVNTKTP